jgi:hypothetical protein
MWTKPSTSWIHIWATCHLPVMPGVVVQVGEVLAKCIDVGRTAGARPSAKVGHAWFYPLWPNGAFV